MKIVEMKRNEIRNPNTMILDRPKLASKKYLLASKMMNSVDIANIDVEPLKILCRTNDFSIGNIITERKRVITYSKFPIRATRMRLEIISLNSLVF